MHVDAYVCKQNSSQPHGSQQHIQRRIFHPGSGPDLDIDNAPVGISAWTPLPLNQKIKL